LPSKTKDSPAQTDVATEHASTQTVPHGDADAVQDDVVARVLLEHAGVVYRTRDPRRAVNYLDLSKLGEEGETPASEEIWLAVDDDGADEDDDENKGFLSSSEDDHSLSVETDKLSIMATMAGHAAEDNLISSLTSSSPQSVLVSAGVPTDGRKDVLSVASGASASATQLLHGVLIDELVPIVDTLHMTEKSVLDLTLKFQQVETLLQSLCSAVDRLRSTSSDWTPLDSLLTRLEALAADIGACDAPRHLREDNNQLRMDLTQHRQREEFLVGRMQQMETALAGLSQMQPVAQSPSQHIGHRNARVEGSAAPAAPAATATTAAPVSMSTAEESVTNAPSAPPPDSALEQSIPAVLQEAPKATQAKLEKEEAKREIKKALLKKAKDIERKEPAKSEKSTKISKCKPVSTKAKTDDLKSKQDEVTPKEDISLPDQASAIESELVAVESKEDCPEDWKVTITSRRDLELVAETPQTVVVSPKPQEPAPIVAKAVETKIPVPSKAPKLKPPIKPKATAKESAEKPKAVKVKAAANARSDPIPKPPMLPAARPPRDYRPTLVALAAPQSVQDQDSVSRCDDADVIHMVIREDRDAASVGDHSANPSLFQVERLTGCQRTEKLFQ
jgi:hypothetical protein